MNMMNGAAVAGLVDKHKPTLEKAAAAAGARGYWSLYPEHLKAYGETAKDDGEAAFKAHLGKAFDIEVPGASGTVGSEQSPFGVDLGITYPKPDIDAVLKAAQGAMKGWRRASADQRAAVCVEILERLNKKTPEILFAVMHTTGQAFMMAFQAGGPHAQDRG
ncbi:MAG: phenylacetic acid degradation protein PaaN, partial [Caenispirillum sp.]|nr:phenylacetic acid degradation protein PaaN [Caenispirillum sp.]